MSSQLECANTQPKRRARGCYPFKATSERANGEANEGGATPAGEGDFGPPNATQWSLRSMAAAAGVSYSSLQRIWCYLVGVTPREA